jgi:hypothetical protein
VVEAVLLGSRCRVLRVETLQDGGQWPSRRRRNGLGTDRRPSCTHDQLREALSGRHSLSNKVPRIVEFERLGERAGCQSHHRGFEKHVSGSFPGPDLACSIVTGCTEDQEGASIIARVGMTGLSEP